MNQMIEELAKMIPSDAEIARITEQNTDPNED